MSNIEWDVVALLASHHKWDIRPDGPEGDKWSVYPGNVQAGCGSNGELGPALALSLRRIELHRKGGRHEQLRAMVCPEGRAR